MKLKVKITKEILRKSMMCGVSNSTKGKVSENCAVALAVREIFPDASIATDSYDPFHSNPLWNNYALHNGEDFIDQFDKLYDTPEKRLELPETEVTLDITDEILDELNKNHNWQEIVNNIGHLELVE